ncbi:MAG: helix-turn-helix domain-containing protein [Acidobacteriota bacterium]|jgi:cytoskeletal protein RodZ
MLRDAMTEKQRGNTKQPPWHRDTDGESVPFGPWLRRQREMREITLREISDASKISLRYLQALEDERFDLLPAMVFAKGFLRQYARYVGLDQDEVVNRFLVAQQGDEPDEEDEQEGERDAAHRAGALEGTWKYVVLIIALAIVLLGLVFLIPHVFDGGDGAETSEPPPGVAPPQTGGSAAASAPEPARNEPSGAVRTSPDLPPEVPDAPLRVTLDFREDCWVEATVDGERRVSEMRVQGESLQLQAQESVELRLGNAGVVAVEVNGRPYPLDAGPGAVRRVRIDLSDLPGATPSPRPTTGEGDGEQGGTGGGDAAGPPS